MLMSSGERLPLLIDSNGQPIFNPTVFSLTELRSTNLASSTIESSLRSIMIFLIFLDLRKIDLERRFDAGQLFSLGEIEELVRLCRLPMGKIFTMLDEAEIESKQSVVQVISLERLRMRSDGAAEEEIDPASAATRLRNIRRYLNWLAINRMSRHGADMSFRAALESSTQYVVNAIEARLPSAGHRNGTFNQREGLEPDVVDRVLKITSPHSPENPWEDEHSRYRNALIIEWFLYLGLRKGELLNIRIRDIDFRSGTVTVFRRADDLNDPRKNQPKVKTRGREIPLFSSLLDKTNAYIMNQRSSVRGARKHDFLLVSSDAGAPLSISSLSKIFNVLRAKCPELPSRIFPHIFRHTWNDRFSAEMDKRQVSEETEKKTRSYLMGWSETSGTAATYTRRFIRKKAREVSLEMQRQIIDEDVPQ